MILIIWLFCFTFMVKSAKSLACDYHDTINISSGTLDNDGRFKHNGLFYHRELFAEFDYVITNHSTVKVDPHYRGCVCNLKSCVRICQFCSDDDTSLNLKCYKKSSDLKIPSSSPPADESISLNTDKYVVLVGKLCRKYFKLDFELYGDVDQWTLLPVIIQIFQFCLKINTKIDITLFHTPTEFPERVAENVRRSDSHSSGLLLCSKPNECRRPI